MFLVYDLGSLCLWQDKIEKEEQSEPGVEWDPMWIAELEGGHATKLTAITIPEQNEAHPRLSKQGAS